MKVLWITNTQVKNDVNDCKKFREGWLTGALGFLLTNQNIQFSNAFPNGKKVDMENNSNIHYYSFYYDMIGMEYSENLCEQIKAIYQKFEPDIIHIWGTEFFHTYAATEAAKRLNLQKRVIINIQGLISIYSKHYMLGIEELKCRRTLFEIIKKRGLKRDAELFKWRGEFERKALKNVNHVVGRTTWDKACVTQINPSLEYHYGGEIMRSSFYDGEKWNVRKCEKHTIFISQATYPIKGLHFLLDALILIKECFPHVMLNIAAEKIFEKTSRFPFVNAYMLLSTYERYLYKKICDNDLWDNINFLGGLSAVQMKEQYLKANVAVNVSTIENSSNSITEAMLLGVPMVSSYVGGSPDLIEHKVSGFLYPCDEPYMLAYYVMEIFNNPGVAEEISRNAQKYAKERADIKKNGMLLLELYEQLNN